MSSHKEEYYFNLCQEYVKAFRKIKKQCRFHDPDDVLSATERIYNIIDKLDLESGWKHE